MRERLTPLFFGSLGRRLFGCLHQPVDGSGPARELGLVLCPAQGHEYIQFHRAYRKLALQLSSAGFSVLRFDLSGCGDSPGDEQDWSLERWRADTATAIDELKQQVRVERVGLVGLRLGATLANQVAATRDDVEALVLWDPVLSGAAYLAEMQAQHQRMLGYAHVLPAKNAAGDEILGFAMPAALGEDLHALDLLSQGERPAEHVLVVQSNELFDQTPCQQHLAGLGSRAELQSYSNPHLWAWIEDFGKVHVPRQILDALVSWFSQVPA
jgi:pimeloyl-ACP methyl ester carboxylesterase